jgi:hypothetical protein
MALLGKRPSPYYGKNSSNKQREMSIITLRHEGQLMRKIKNFEGFFKCTHKPSSAMMKLALMRTATGKEDPELPLLQRISSLVTSQHQLFIGDCVAFMVEVLRRNHD